MPSTSGYDNWTNFSGSTALSYVKHGQLFKVGRVDKAAFADMKLDEVQNVAIKSTGKIVLKSSESCRS